MANFWSHVVKGYNRMNLDVSKNDFLTRSQTENRVALYQLNQNSVEHKTHVLKVTG